MKTRLIYAGVMLAMFWRRGVPAALRWPLGTREDRLELALNVHPWRHPFAFMVVSALLLGRPLVPDGAALEPPRLALSIVHARRFAPLGLAAALTLWFAGTPAGGGSAALMTIGLLAVGSIIEGGVVIQDGVPRAINPFGKIRHVQSGETAQTAVNAGVAGDVVYLDGADYDEALTITTDNLTLVGVGSRGAAAVAPSAANSIAVTIEGTAGTGRIEEVTLINIGGEGKGTGGGLYIAGNVRRVRAYGCKFEGGAFALKVEGKAVESPADLIFEDCELAWTTAAIHITASGGGNSVTNARFRKCLLHNYDRGLLNDVAAVSDLWVWDCLFARKENGAAPATDFVNIMAGAGGIFAGNWFDHPTMATAVMVIPTNIRWVGNMTEAGIGGRPA